MYHRFVIEDAESDFKILQDLASLDRRQLVNQAREIENIAFRLGREEGLF